MGYQPNSGRTSSGRSKGFDKLKKARTRKLTIRHSSEQRRGVTGVMSLKETVSRTLNGLDNLGIQIFVMPPFSQHFDRWLKSLITVLDDFEGTPIVATDNRFHMDRGEILSAIDAAFNAEQAKEASRSEKILGLHKSKDLLFRLEQVYNAKIKEFSIRRDQSLKSHTNTADALQIQLNDILETKAGLFEAFTKDKTRKEREARSRYTSAENQLNAVKTSFSEELTGLQSEYERNKQEIFEKMTAERREIEKLEAEAEIDGSVEIRRVACEELTEAVKVLVKRINDSEKFQNN